MNHIFVKTLLPFVILLSLAGFFISTNASSVNISTPNTKQEIRWYSLEEAMLLAEKEHKPILINVYANWNNSCKKMDTETFSKPSVINYINKHYYAVRVEATSHDKVNFSDTTIDSQQLVQYIFKVRSYPSIVYINADKVMTTVAGYQSSDDLEMYLRYFSR
jgi:thioredoxin-related protein